MKKTDFFMRENKLVQEALIQMKNVEEAIAENAKGILASTMKEEINQLVKESLSEQDEDEIELDVDADTDVDAETDNEDEMEMDLDMDVDGDEDEMEMDIDMDSMESPIDLTDASDEEILKVFKAMGEEDGIIIKKDGDDVHLTDNDADVEYLVKLGESEEESEMMSFDDEDTDSVIDAIFAEMENMDEEDEFDNEEEEEEIVYEISLDDDSEMMEDDSEMMEDDSEMMDDDSDEEEFANESYNPKKGMKKVKPTGVGIGSGPKFSYKKTSGGFKEDKKEGPKEMGTGKAKFDYKKGTNMEGKSKVVKTETKEGQGYKDKEDERLAMKHGKIASKDLKTTKARRDDAGFEKAETKEAARTYGMGSKEGRGLRKGITNNRNYVYKNGVTVESLDAEVNMLREKNEEYRKALNVFREKLNEVAIFNSNLAYATRLFTEHSTTKKEKINILRRFDDVETLKESKSLYRSIKEELGTTDTKSINESVGNKLNKTVTTGSSTTLIESKTYENPQFLRMKDLMGKLG
jgi:hypothetical protein